MFGPSNDVIYCHKVGQSWDFSSLKDRPYFSSLLDSNHLTRSSQLRFWPICGTPVEFPANPQSEFLAHCSVVSILFTSFGLHSILCACVSILSRSWVKPWSCMISRSCSLHLSWILKRLDRSKIVVKSDWIHNIGWFFLSSELDFWHTVLWSLFQSHPLVYVLFCVHVYQFCQDPE